MSNDKPVPRVETEISRLQDDLGAGRIDKDTYERLKAHLLANAGIRDQQQASVVDAEIVYQNGAEHPAKGQSREAIGSSSKDATSRLEAADTASRACPPIRVSKDEPAHADRISQHKNAAKPAAHSVSATSTLSFGEWYKRKFQVMSTWPVPLNVLGHVAVWWFYGFIWIPIAYFSSRHVTTTNNNEIDRKKQDNSRTPEGETPLRIETPFFDEASPALPRRDWQDDGKTLVPPLDGPTKFSNADIAKFRQHLTAYAAGIPHHGLGNLGMRATAITGMQIPIYAVKINTLYENRIAVRKTKPHRGQSVSACVVDKSNIQLWSYDYPSGFAFEERAVEHEISGSQRVEDCAECGKAGRITCPKCGAAKYVECPSCKGSRYKPCRKCDGKGTVREKRIERYQDICTGGLGVGRCQGGYSTTYGKICHYCNGTGVRWYERKVPIDVPCPQCQGAGRVFCSTCSGLGRLECTTCDPNGEIICPSCDGEKEIIAFLALKREFTPFEDRKVLSSDSAVAPAIQDALKQGCDFEVCVEQADVNYRTDPLYSTGISSIDNALVEACREFRQFGTDENRVVRQTVTVEQATVIRGCYRFDKTEYEFFIIPKQKVAIVAQSPISEFVNTSVNRSVAEWKSGNREAATRLRECFEIGKADKGSQDVIDKLAKTIPDDLKKAVRNQEKVIAVGNAIASPFRAVKKWFTGEK